MCRIPPHACIVLCIFPIVKSTLVNFPNTDCRVVLCSATPQIWKLDRGRVQEESRCNRKNKASSLKDNNYSPLHTRHVRNRGVTSTTATQTTCQKLQLNVKFFLLCAISFRFVNYRRKNWVSMPIPGCALQHHCSTQTKKSPKQ